MSHLKLVFRVLLAIMFIIGMSPFIIEDMFSDSPFWRIFTRICFFVSVVFIAVGAIEKRVKTGSW